MKSSQANSPENIIEQWANYFNAGNLDGISDMYHNESTLLPTFLPKLLSSKNEIKGYFNVAFKGKATVTVDTSKSIRKKLSETSYIMTGSYVFCLKSRESKDYLSWYTFLVDLSSDSPIRHHHSSRVPFEFDLSQTEEKH
jgi:hypothetical protein